MLYIVTVYTTAANCIPPAKSAIRVCLALLVSCGSGAQPAWERPVHLTQPNCCDPLLEMHTRVFWYEFSNMVAEYQLQTLFAALLRPVPILRFKVRSTDAWRARRVRAYNGGLGAEPPAGSRAEPLVRGSGGRSPLKLKAF